MRNPLISIIIPIYNVEKYLSDCLNSVISQTYRNIEIILVNDGSTDNCSNICDRYVKIDSRIKVIEKENGGLSDARNVGMKASKGNYITFIDSDDFIHRKYIEVLWNGLKQKKADISICNYRSIKEEETFCNEKYYKCEIKRNIVMNNKECLKKMYLGEVEGLEFLAWGKLYKKELFDNNEIEYPKGKIHEDTFTTYKLIYFTNKVTFIDEKLYFYRKRQGSIMNQKFNIESIVKLDAKKEACDFYSNYGEEILLKFAFNDYLKSLVQFYYNIECSNYRTEDKIKKKLRDNFKRVYKSYIGQIEYPIKKRIFYKIILKIPKGLRKYILKNF